MTEEEKKALERSPKRPTRYQAKQWSDTILQVILNSTLFKLEGSVHLIPGLVDDAKEIGSFFPGFWGAFDTWTKNPNSFNETVLKQEAEKVFLALPVPYDHPDICPELDAAEERIAELERQLKLQKGLLDESKKLRRQALDVASKFQGLLSRSIRVEEGYFGEEHGARFILGQDHVVAEWRGDGVSIDRIFVEKPALRYGETTTPYIRCLRMVLELVHWPVLCAMSAGPGDGELRELEPDETNSLRYNEYPE